MTGALVAVGIAALVGLTVAIFGIPPHEQRRAGVVALEADDAAASQGAVADRQPRRPAATATTASSWSRSRPTTSPTRACRCSSPCASRPRTAATSRSHDEKGVLYQMCGLGPNCPIDRGKPSQRAQPAAAPRGLELALYTFRYLGRQAGRGAHPAASPGKAQTVALYFQPRRRAPRARPAADLVAAADGADGQDRHCSRPTAGWSTRRRNQLPLLAHGLELQPAAATSCSTPTARRPTASCRSA